MSFFRKQAVEAEKQKLVTQKEKAELETQLAKSRNAYLQQQIKPHILFNTLNFVYSNAQKYSDDAAHCIWLLAEIMRFSLEEPNYNGKINLEREVEQIENMLALNRYRFEKPLYISIEMYGNFSNFQIIPLILLTLTENIFKHGNLTEAGQPGILNITIDEAGKLIFFSRNLKKPKNKHPRRQQALGLENIRIRLDTTYAGNYKLDISEPGEFYELTLTLSL
ncbi:sensor histidine kinase [Pedobacter rhodius]|uniref:Histidine kinase n=1 Tax=Pedobacter rhodius TaxID=3004098 RepID=A0ABT4L0W4_9SPHI|nr:histidine kinase [Pedobacter sp. SJ11]MCZ4224828.1 histidine kinase [Pedobacter sp. SJ11]